MVAEAAFARTATREYFTSAQRAAMVRAGGREGPEMRGPRAALFREPMHLKPTRLHSSPRL